MPNPGKPVVTREEALKLFAENMRLAFHLARRRQVPGATDDEKDQAALEGLWNAATLFDPGKGYAFSTYSWYAVQRRLTRLRKDVSGQRREVPETDYCPDGRPLKVSEHRPGPAEEAEARDTAAYLRDALAAALGRLTVRERRIIRWRYFDGLTLQAIGDREGISKERVRQVVKRLLGRLRGLLEGVG